MKGRNKSEEGALTTHRKSSNLRGGRDDHRGQGGGQGGGQDNIMNITLKIIVKDPTLIKKGGKSPNQSKKLKTD